MNKEIEVMLLELIRFKMRELKKYLSPKEYSILNAMGVQAKFVYGLDVVFANMKLSEILSIVYENENVSPFTLEKRV